MSQWSGSSGLHSPLSGERLYCRSRELRNEELKLAAWTLGGYVDYMLEKNLIVFTHKK